MPAYDKLLSSIKSNIPSSSLFYSTTVQDKNNSKRSKISKNNSKNSKISRSEISSDIKSLSYSQLLCINSLVEREFSLILTNNTVEYFMQRLYEYPLVGMKVEMSGISGIIMHESRNRIHIVTEKNKKREMEKKGSVFIVEISSRRYLLLGEHMRMNRQI